MSSVYLAFPAMRSFHDPGDEVAGCNATNSPCYLAGSEYSDADALLQATEVRSK